MRDSTTRMNSSSVETLHSLGSSPASAEGSLPSNQRKPTVRWTIRPTDSSVASTLAIFASSFSASAAALSTPSLAASAAAASSSSLSSAFMCWLRFVSSSMSIISACCSCR